MKQIDIIPELNFWFKRELSNASVYDTYHKIPVEMSDQWRESRSVIELLFNETFDPQYPNIIFPDTIESENDKPYIYRYRNVNLLRITDKNLLNRIQLYRWWSNIYSANSNKFFYLFNMQGSVSDLDNDVVNEASLPFDINEEDRSPYITYQTYNGSFTSYPLWQTGEVDPDKIEEIQNPIINDAVIFEFTDLTFQMLDKLYDYKTGKNVNLKNITFGELDSCLSKLIYIYLDAVLNDSYEHYDNIDCISDGTDILCSLYEKHVLNFLYLLRSKSYGVIWNDSEIINNKIVPVREDFFVILKKKIVRTRVTQQVLYTKKFIITDNVPWNRKDFTFYKDGVILEQDKDFTVVMDVSDARNVKAEVKLLRDDFVDNELVEFIWSYVEPISYISEQEEINNTEQIILL